MAINTSDYPNKIVSNLWADKNFHRFYYSFLYEKKKYRGIINLSDRVSWNKKDKISYAQVELLKIKNSKKDSLVDADVKFDKFMSNYFKTIQENKHTKILKSHYDRYISPSIGGLKVVDVRQIHIRKIIKELELQGLSPRTVKRTLEVLSPALKNAIADRLISYSPLDGISVKQPKTKKIVNEASDKLAQIHAAIYKVFGDDPYYLSLFLFALQGRRKGEVITLRWEDISFEHSYYILRNTKNNEEQKIFLSSTIKEQLLEIPRVNEWVFASRINTAGHIVDIRKATNKLKVELGDEKFGIHYLRNVIVSAMAEQGFDSIHLSGALGHNDPNTIKKYLTMNYLKSSEMASGVIDGVVKRA